MAISAQNVVVWYGNSIIQELQDLEVECLRGDWAFRDGQVVLRRTGTLLLRGFSMQNLPHDDVGRGRIMAITVPSGITQRLVLWHGWARYDQCVVSAVRNQAVLFAFRFTLGNPFPTSGTLY